MLRLDLLVAPMVLLAGCGLFGSGGSAADDDDDGGGGGWDLGDGDGGSDGGSGDGGSDGGSGDGGSDGGSGDGGSDGGSGDGGSGGSGDARHFGGAVTSWPVVIEDTIFDTAELPVVTVLWSSDGGLTYGGDWEYCNGGYSFSVTSGRLTIPETYCTGGATHYLVSAQAPDEHHQGSLSYPLQLSTELADMDAPPLATAWFQGDDGWYTTAVYCSGGNSSHIFDGVFQVNDTYCTPNSGSYQVSLAAPATTHVGTIGRSSATVSDGALRLSALPVVHVWFEGDAVLYQKMQYCSGGYTYDLQEGQLDVNDTYCTSDGQGFVVSIGE